MSADLRELSLTELFELQAHIGREFQRRGLSRTAGSIQGEVGEYLALAVYGGMLPPPGREHTTSRMHRGGSFT